MFLGRTLHVLCVAWLLGHKILYFCTYRPLKKGVRHSPTFPYTMAYGQNEPNGDPLRMTHFSVQRIGM